MKEGKMIFLYDSCLKTCVDSKTFAFWAYLVFTLFIIECFFIFVSIIIMQKLQEMIACTYCTWGLQSIVYRANQQKLLSKKDKVGEDEEYP